MQYSICFDDITLDYRETEGIKYIGSKLKIIPSILELAKQTNAKSIFDGFSGSTRVSQAFAQLGYPVISNDIAVWSEVFGTCYLLNNRSYDEYQELIDHLNSVPPRDGWFTEHMEVWQSNQRHVNQMALKSPGRSTTRESSTQFVKKLTD